MPSLSAIPMTALVVDDSMLIRHTVCRILEKRGFLVEAAINGVEALAVLERFVPDIIITDLSMPRMGGEELVSRIRTIGALADTPILILTARCTGTGLSAGLLSGTSAVIFKNIDIEEQLGLALESILVQPILVQPGA